MKNMFVMYGVPIILGTAVLVLFLNLYFYNKNIEKLRADLQWDKIVSFETCKNDLNAQSYVVEFQAGYRFVGAFEKWRRLPEYNQVNPLITSLLAQHFVRHIRYGDPIPTKSKEDIK